MDDPKIVTATEASRSFSELLHRVCYGGESFLIKKGNRLMAHITPVVTANPDAECARPQIINEVAQDLTTEESEFYQAWLEQVQKVEA